MTENQEFQIYRITAHESNDSAYERNRIFSVFALKTSEGQYIVSNFHKPELQEVSKVKLTEMDGDYYSQIYHVFTRDYDQKCTQTYIFKANDQRDILSSSSSIFNDNANFVERTDGFLILGALFADNQINEILSFLGIIDQVRIINDQYFSTANDQLLNYLCEVGQYYSEDTCKSCHETCETCSNELQESCLSCYDGSYLYSGQCVDSCPYEEKTEENQSIIQTYKVPAKKSCVSAFSDCPTGFFVKENQKVCNYCGHYVTYCLTCNEEECLTCEDGYYPDQLSCFACDKSCETCSSLNVCTKCIINYYLTEQGKCEENDPEEGCQERSYSQFGGKSIGSITKIKTLPYKSNQILAVVTENDYMIRIWDITTGSYLRELEGHTDPINQIIFVEEFSYLVSSGISDLFFWDIDKGEVVKQISFVNKFNYFVYHKEFQQIIVVSDIQHYEKQIKVFSLDLNNLNKDSITLLTFIPISKGSPLCILAPEQNSEILLIGGEQFLVDINVYSNSIRQQTQFGSNAIDIINLQASSSCVAVGLSESKIQIFSLSKLTSERNIIFTDKIVSLKDVNNGNQWFLVNFDSGVVKIIDYSNTLFELKIISTTNAEKGYFAMDIFSDYPYIAVSYNDNYDSYDEAKQNYLQTIRIINYETTEHVMDINGWYQTKTTECISSLTKEEVLCFTTQMDQPQNISKLTLFNMTIGYPNQVKFMGNAVSGQIADIIQKQDGIYLLCFKNRQVIYLTDELDIIKSFQLEEIDKTEVERCAYFQDTIHGNLLIQGYYESFQIGIYQETSSILSINNLQKIATVEHFNLLGSFIQAKPYGTSFIVIKGIYTKESQPVLYNLESQNYMRTLFTKPHNNLIGCTGIGWFSYEALEYLITMWRQPSQFELYLTKVSIESNNQIRFSNSHFRKINLGFYSGGGRIFQIETTQFVLLNDGNQASKLLNVLNYQIVSNLAGNFGKSWVLFDDYDRNYADITWDIVPLYFLKEDSFTHKLSIFITRLDEQQKNQKFGRIYGKGLDFTLTYYTYCLSSDYQFEFNSIQEYSAAQEQSISNLNLRIKQFESINFGGCDINQFTIQVLFLSGSTCTITEYSETFGQSSMTIQSEKWKYIYNLTLIIDIFKGTEYAILNEYPYELIIQDFTEVYIRNVNFKWNDQSKLPNWYIQSEKDNTLLSIENVTFKLNLTHQQQVQTLFYSNMINNQLCNIKIIGFGMDNVNTFYNSSILFEFEQYKSSIYIANFELIDCQFQNSMIFKIQAKEKHPQTLIQIQNFTVSSVQFFNSQILLGIGLDQSIINNTLIQNCVMKKNESIEYLAMFEFDSSNISMFYLDNNSINIDYLFKNYQNENNLNPSFNFTDIVLSNNNISISTDGWLLKLHIKNIQKQHNVMIMQLQIKDTKFKNIAATSIAYKFLMTFSSLVSVNIQEININSGNSGFENIGIIQIITFDRSYLTLSNAEISGISNFISSENTNITINSLSITNAIVNTVTFSSIMDIAYMLLLQDSALTLKYSTFKTSSLFAVYSLNIEPVDIQIYDTTFESISGSQSDGSTLCLQNSNVKITNSIFFKCSSVNGGAIQLQNSEYQHSITETQFNNNKASQYGGAIYADKNSIVLQECIFFENTAEQGGAIYFIGDYDLEYILILQESVEFIKNAAKIGGCVKYENLAPYVEDNNYVVFTNNTAEYYGSKFSSGYPAKIKFLNESFSNDTEFQTANDSNDEVIYTLTNLASGQEIDFCFTFALYDENEEVIKNYTDSALFMTLSYDLSEVEKSEQIYYWLSGDTSVKNNNDTNEFVFCNLIFNGKQNKEVTLSIVCSQIHYLPIGTGIESLQLLNDYEYKNIKIIFRQCITGEIVVETSTSETCKKCEPGYYSINPSINVCLKCPDNAKCEGGDTIIVSQGYWRPSQYSAIITICQNNLESCYSDSVEQEENTNQISRLLEESSNSRTKYGNQLCAKGFIGYKCEACDEYHIYWDKSYYRKAEGQCHVCSYDFQKIATLILTSFVSFISMAMSISTQSQKTDEDKLHGALMKMLLHHIQILAVIQSIGMIKKTMEIQDQLNISFDFPITMTKSVGTQVEASSSSLECFLIKLVNRNLFPFIKIAVALLMPILMFFMFIIFYYVSTKVTIKLNKNKRNKYAKQLELLSEEMNEHETYKQQQILKNKINSKEVIAQNSENFAEQDFINRSKLQNAFDLETAAFGTCIFKDEKTHSLKFEVMNTQNQTKQLNQNLKKKVTLIKDYLQSPAPKIDWNIIYSTLVFIVIFCQPNIVNQLLGMIFCKSIYLEETDVTLKFIHSNPSYECYTDLHVKYLLCMILPAFLVWVILIPIGMYRLLFKHRNEMGTKEANFKFGLMVEEYRKDKFYWEFFKMALKLGMQFILIFCENNVGKKGVFIGVAFTLYMLAAFFMTPFNTEFFNQIDKRSTLIGFFSTQLVLFAYYSQIYSAMLAYFLMYLVNGIFLVSIISYIVKNKMKKVKEIIGKIKVIVQKIKKKFNNYEENDSLITEEIQNKDQIKQQQLRKEQTIDQYMSKIWKEINQIEQFFKQNDDLLINEKLELRLQKIYETLGKPQLKLLLQGTQYLKLKQKASKTAVTEQQLMIKENEETNIFSSNYNMDYQPQSKMIVSLQNITQDEHANNKLFSTQGIEEENLFYSIRKKKREKINFMEETNDLQVKFDDEIIEELKLNKTNINQDSIFSQIKSKKITKLNFREEFEKETNDFQVINFKVDDEIIEELKFNKTNNINSKKDHTSIKQNKRKKVNFMKLKKNLQQELQLKINKTNSQKDMEKQQEDATNHLELIPLKVDDEIMEELQEKEKLIYEQTFLPYNQPFLFASKSRFQIFLQISFKQTQDNFDSLELELKIKGKNEPLSLKLIIVTNKISDKLQITISKSNPAKAHLKIKLRKYEFDAPFKNCSLNLYAYRISSKKEEIAQEINIPYYLHQFCCYQSLNSTLENDIQLLIEGKHKLAWEIQKHILLVMQFKEFSDLALKFPNIAAIQTLQNEESQSYHGVFQIKINFQSFQFYYCIKIYSKKNELEIKAISISKLENCIDQQLKDKQVLLIKDLEQENQKNFILIFWACGIEQLFSNKIN